MFLSSLQELKRTRGVTLCALFIALFVIIDFLGIEIPTLQITFKFLPLAAMGMFLGPSTAFLAGGIADVLAYLAHLNGQAFHFGFTLSTMLTGLVFGVFLYRRELKVWRLIVSTAIINVFINILLNTYWLSKFYGKGYLLMLPSRIWKNILFLPLEVIIAYVVLKAVQNFKYR